MEYDDEISLVRGMGLSAERKRCVCPSGYLYCAGSCVRPRVLHDIPAHIQALGELRHTFARRMRIINSDDGKTT